MQTELIVLLCFFAVFAGALLWRRKGGVSKGGVSKGTGTARDQEDLNDLR